MSETHSPKHLGNAPFHREIELDFIRGIAILLVMDFHTPGSPFKPIFLYLGYVNHIGWIGVDIFFVLSGFLVGGLLLKEWKVRRGIDAKRFLIRRGFKIWPQYYVFLAVVLLSGHDRIRFLWGNLLNIQNYVGGIAHTWSLAVEEHCYLLLVLLMVVAARWRVRMRSLFFFLLAVCLLEIPLRYILIMTGHLIYEPTHTRLDSIGYGVLLAMLFHFAPERFERLRAVPWLWTLCIALALIILRPYGVPAYVVAMQHDAATLFAISVLLVLYRPLPQGRRHNWLYRAVAWIGLYSYGIYLWHISTIHVSEALLRPFHWLSPFASGALLRLAEIAVGVLTTCLCEFPMLRLRDRIFPRRVDTPVGTPALDEVPDPASAHLQL